MKHSLTTSASLLLGLALTAPAAVAQIPFTAGATLATGQNPDTVAFGDFDQDCDPDLAVTSDNLDKIELWTNDGSGAYTFAGSILTGAGTGASALVARDYDADGRTDLAVSLHNTNAVAVYRNTGGGLFALVGTTTTGADPADMAAGDVDGDGDVDLATSNRDDSSVTVLLNNGSGVMTAAGSTVVGSDLRGIVLADVDGDGLADVAVSSHDSREVYVLRSTGAGALAAATAHSVGAQFRPDGITAADLDGNGFADLAVSISGNGLNFVAVFANAAGSFGAAVNWSVPSVNPDSIVAADFDVDNDWDLAVSGQDSNDITVLENNGAGMFPATSTVSTGTRPGGLATADIDGDADADLAVANRDANSVSLATNGTDPAGGATYCISAANSAGAGALIDNTGSTSIAANNFTLTVCGAPATEFGLFYYGPDQIQTPFGDGVRCVGGLVHRLNPPIQTDLVGSSSRHVDFTDGPAVAGPGMILPGSSWNFQFWYRDAAAAGAGFNLSDALSVTFMP